MSWKQSMALRIGLLAVLLYLFFLGLDMMGLAFKAFGKDFAEQLVTSTSNPFAGLVIGILATSLIQSSSTTTSMVVGLVAADALSLSGAIPIIMGANIGTSVTNTLVSLGHATRKEEFRRAFAAATVHDFFNWLTVLVLFPLELATGYLRSTAHYMEEFLEGTGGIKVLDPLKTVVRPTGEFLSGLFGDSGIITLILGLLFLFAALKTLVDLLKVILSSRAEEILHKTLFRSAWHGLAAGTLITMMVQSSSVTTSTIVPLVGAGVLTLRQAFPFTLGANIGTTVTALLAGLATGNPAGITVALTHLLFNLTGTALFYPIIWIRRIPLYLAGKMGDLGARSRLLAGLYIIVAFYLLPLLMLFFSGALSNRPPAENQAPPAVEQPGDQTSSSRPFPSGTSQAGGFQSF